MSGPVVALVLAAGRGARLGGQPKAGVLLGGRPLAAHCLETLGACAAVDAVVVVGDEDVLAPALDALSPLARAKVQGVVAGGASREESCARGLSRADPESEVVLVHDAARPFASAALFAAVAEAAGRTGAALAALPLADTLKRGAGGRVVETVPRAGLWRAQTPQGARTAVLRRAHAAAASLRQAAGPAESEDGAIGTDDVALVERLGLPVELVPGEAWNVKITTPDDHAWAEAWLTLGTGGRR